MVPVGNWDNFKLDYRHACILSHFQIIKIDVVNYDCYTTFDWNKCLNCEIGIPVYKEGE